MKCKFLWITICFALLFSNVCHGFDYPDGYDDAKWGMSRNEVLKVIQQEGKTVIDDASSGSITAWGKNTWAGSSKVEIDYGFNNQGRLEWVQIEFGFNKYNAIYEYFCSRYGWPRSPTTKSTMYNGKRTSYIEGSEDKYEILTESKWGVTPEIYLYHILRKSSSTDITKVEFSAGDSRI